MPGLMDTFRNPTSAESWGKAAVDIALIGLTVAKLGQASKFANAGRIGEEVAAFGKAGRAAERFFVTRKSFAAFKHGAESVNAAINLQKKLSQLEAAQLGCQKLQTFSLNNCSWFSSKNLLSIFPNA